MSLGTVAPGFAWIFPFSRLFAFSANFGDHSVKPGEHWSLLYDHGITSEHTEEEVPSGRVCFEK